MKENPIIIQLVEGLEPRNDSNENVEEEDRNVNTKHVMGEEGEVGSENAKHVIRRRK